MRMRAVDSFHASDVSRETLHAGTEFEVNDARGKELLERGLAVEVDAKAKEPEKAPEKPPAKAVEPVEEPARPAARDRR